MKIEIHCKLLIAVEVIPAIIAKDIKELAEKIRLVEPYVKWVQIDVVDGEFAPNITWNDPEGLQAEDFSVFLEADLMIADPAQHFDRWIASGVKRIFVHIEAIGAEISHTVSDSLQHQIVDMAEKAHLAGVEFGLSLLIETPVSAVEDFLAHCDAVLLLAVRAGFGGQHFDENVLQKIRTLREKNADISIEVDGGIQPETAKKCAEAKATILAAGSYIFGSKDIQGAIEQLRRATS